MTTVSQPKHHCRAIVVSCMDFRLQTYLRKWTEKKFKNNFDRLSLPGGVKNFAFVLEQIALSFKLHHIKEVYLINHQDCGAYSAKGNFETHKQDLVTAKQMIKQELPDLKTFLFYLKLNGEFVEVI